MKRVMTAILTALIVIGWLTPVQAADGLWLVDFEAARKAAEAENKDLLLEFTGSDWCPPCIQLKKQVFDTNEFKTQAPKDFVLVKLDYPRNTSGQTPSEIEQNEKLLGLYAITGYPTVILADSRGRPYARIGGFVGTTPADYIKNLKSLQQVRVRRDQTLSKAQAAEGVDRAKLLDQAIGALDEELPIGNTYLAEIRQIVAADADNSAGLKEKYQVMLIEGQLQHIIVESGADLQGAVTSIDKLIAEDKPTGQLLQHALYVKASALFQLKRKDEAKSTLKTALDAAPDTARADEIRELLEQLF